MWKIVGIVAAVLVAAVAVVLVIAATKPDDFRVQRSARIQAPLQKIAPLIADFHAWTAWSPYEKLDPAMQRTYAGAASGKGAVYEWADSGQVGQGRMEILDASPAKI